MILVWRTLLQALHAALASKPRAKKITKQDLWEVDSEVRLSFFFSSSAYFCMTCYILLHLLPGVGTCPLGQCCYSLFFECFLLVVVVVVGPGVGSATGRRGASVHAL